MYIQFTNVIGALFFASLGAISPDPEMRIVGFGAGFCFGWFLMSVLRIWRRAMLMTCISISRKDPEMMDQVRDILPDGR